MQPIKTYLFVLLIFVQFTPQLLLADGDNRQPVLSGYIKDAETGEILIGAALYVKEVQMGCITNSYGFYSLSLPKGNYTLVVAYLGFETIEQKIELINSTMLNFSLKPESAQLVEVMVVGDKSESRVATTQTGVEKLSSKTIKDVPSLMGEVDPIKVLQLLPGVQAASEGSSGFSVRGGNPDQNLILLDEAIVYNAGHLLGFFSVFNNDAIKDLKLYKGDIPAKSGGRLASLLDIRMKDGNNQKFNATGGIGTISSRLTLEGPIANDRTTFIVSGRRTYADLFLPLSGDEAVRGNRLYFYDFNAKVSHTFSDRDRIYVSGYFGRDVFKNALSKMAFGNQTLTLRWNHLFNPRLFGNFTLINSHYDYALGTEGSGINSFLWESDLKDYSAKADFNYYPNPKHTLSFGAQTIYHQIHPGFARNVGSTQSFNPIKIPLSKSREHAIYAEDVFSLWSVLNLRAGLRLSAFQNVGAATVYSFNNQGESIDEKRYKKGEVYNAFFAAEPRLGLTWLLNGTTSIKTAYARSVQYLQLASNSTSGTPLDVWFPASPNVKPQMSDQLSVGWVKLVSDNKIELSTEFFYKKMKNAIDFKDYPELLLNDKLEGELKFGKAYALGAEFLVRFNLPSWNGWLGYTYAQSKRKIEDVNQFEWYFSPYDHPHDVSLVINHQLNKRITLSGNWIYFTGAPATFPIGRFESGGNIVPIYSKRNAERMPNYHRLDLGCTLQGRKNPGKRWQGEWVFSVYNAYARHNAWSINFVQDKDDPYLTKAEKTYLFSLIPSVTYNFKF